MDRLERVSDDLKLGYTACGVTDPVSAPELLDGRRVFWVIRSEFFETGAASLLQELIDQPPKG
ncbi:hypothetical protein GCM10027040_10490 [Halomonas shantousis]